MYNEYENDKFFQEYAKMPRSKEGLSAAGEWHQLKPLFPPLHGKSVLDLGCGYGWHCRFSVENGAEHVLGIDLSRKMIEEACSRNPDNRIEYRVCGIEEYEYPENAWDCVVSNLALHYIEDIGQVFRKVYRTCKPGGTFLFNIEHPVFTAGVGQDWIYAEDGKPRYWPVDGYFLPGERKTRFLGCDVAKQHHTLTQIVMGLLDAGFEIQALEEAMPPEEMMDIPGMEDELRRPMMLLIKAMAKNKDRLDYFKEKNNADNPGSSGRALKPGCKEETMRTLYVTDLDGTLLNTRDRISPESLRIINKLVERGMLFTYATARSLESASVVAQGLTLNMPVIVYNGAFILLPDTGEIISALYFTEEEAGFVRCVLNQARISPLVYSYVQGRESVSWNASRENEGIRRYLSKRKGDRRLRPLEDVCGLYDGDVFYYTCIGEKEELMPLYELFSRDGRFRCTIQQELYRPEYLCEIMPRKATKAEAIKFLKALWNCDRIVSFGDAVNDIPMFELSDECYAVENAVPELKKAATGIVDSNDRDGVAKWLERNACFD